MHVAMTRDVYTENDNLHVVLVNISITEQNLYMYMYTISHYDNNIIIAIENKLHRYITIYNKREDN